VPPCLPERVQIQRVIVDLICIACGSGGRVRSTASEFVTLTVWDGGENSGLRLGRAKHVLEHPPKHRTVLLIERRRVDSWRLAPTRLWEQHGRLVRSLESPWGGDDLQLDALGGLVDGECGCRGHCAIYVVAEDAGVRRSLPAPSHGETGFSVTSFDSATFSQSCATIAPGLRSAGGTQGLKCLGLVLTGAISGSRRRPSPC